MVKFFIFLYLDFHIVPIYLVLYANLQVVMALYMQYRQILLVSHDIPGTILYVYPQAMVAFYNI